MHKDQMGQEIAQEISHGIARRIATGIALFLAFVVFIFVGGFIVQQLWNWLLPDIFTLRRITFLEALGLLALSRILFGGFGRGGGSPRSDWRRRGGRKEWWKSNQPLSSPDTASSPSPPAARSE
jgi:hypothetical protein